jgi:predicted nucleic acid-binding protein
MISTSVEAHPASFVDTNVLVYALAADDVSRSRVAQTLLRELMQAQVFHTSTQVLGELYVTLTRKVRTPLAPDEALRYLDRLAEWPVIAPDHGAVREAAQLSARAGLSYWDALVIVAAARSGASRLYTEDLQHGQTILGIEVVNPFRAAAGT